MVDDVSLCQILKDGDGGGSARGGGQAKPRTKVEVINLPPGLSEEQFRNAVALVKNLDDCVDFFYYLVGKARCGIFPRFLFLFIANRFCSNN